VRTRLARDLLHEREQAVRVDGGIHGVGECTLAVQGEIEMKMSLLACVLLALPSFHAAAANDGVLWEITSQMNMPGMPAGMGARTNRICQGDDPERQQGKERSDCKITDKKTSATRTQITMACKDGTMTIDQTYNAARTEFKGVMTMKSSKGNFTVNTSGRKVGNCDAVAERKARDEKMEAMKKQSAAAMAAGAAAQKQSADNQIKQCSSALDNMQYHGFGIHGQCYNNKADKNCASMMDSMAKTQPEVAKSCRSSVGEYCKRFQTQEGFLKAKADENAAKMCGVSTASIKAAQCPRAAKSESLAFLGAYCPVEAKPIAQEHCAGRDYTSKMGGKYATFCQHYLANADFEKPRASAASGTVPQGQQNMDTVKQGVSKGMDKIKGLFGR
jgi:hypothetical protein